MEPHVPRRGRARPRSDAEALSPSATPALTVLDFAVGAVVGVGGAWLLPRAAATPAVAFAVLWFLGTLTGATSAALSAIGIALVLAYRGPLLQLLLDTPSGRLGSRSLRCLAAASWLAGLLPTAAARPATTGAAAPSPRPQRTARVTNRLTAGWRLGRCRFRLRAGRRLGIRNSAPHTRQRTSHRQ